MYRHTQYQVVVKLPGSFRLTAGNRHLHRYCIFTELVPETVLQSLHHSCASELHFVCPSYERDQTISSSLKFLREPAFYNFILYRVRKSYLHYSIKNKFSRYGVTIDNKADRTSHGIPLCAQFCKGLHRYKPDLIQKSLFGWAVFLPDKVFRSSHLLKLGLYLHPIHQNGPGGNFDKF